MQKNENLSQKFSWMKNSMRGYFGAKMLIFMHDNIISIFMHLKCNFLRRNVIFMKASDNAVFRYNSFKAVGCLLLVNPKRQILNILDKFQTVTLDFLITNLDHKPTATENKLDRPLWIETVGLLKPLTLAQ